MLLTVRYWDRKKSVWAGICIMETNDYKLIMLCIIYQDYFTHFSSLSPVFADYAERCLVLDNSIMRHYITRHTNKDLIAIYK